jgi:hypothetical protein
MRDYLLRLQLIQAKAQLILNESSHHRMWYGDVVKALAEIKAEAEIAYNEVAKDKAWESGDR